MLTLPRNIPIEVIMRGTDNRRVVVNASLKAVNVFNDVFADSLGKLAKTVLRGEIETRAADQSLLEQDKDVVAGKVLREVRADVSRARARVDVCEFVINTIDVV